MQHPDQQLPLLYRQQELQGSGEAVVRGRDQPRETDGSLHGRTVNRVGRETLKSTLTGVVTETDIDLIEPYRSQVYKTIITNPHSRFRISGQPHQNRPNQLTI